MTDDADNSNRAGNRYITPPDNFPVEWADEVEPTLLWSWDNFHAPLPPSQMSETISKITSVGVEAANRSFGRTSSESRNKTVNGYPYQAVITGGRPDEGAYEEAITMAIPFVAERWATEWLPELEADLARFKEIELSALSDAEILEHVNSILETSKRHWEIHFLVVFPVGSSVKRLEDAYKDLTGTDTGDDVHALIDSSQTKTVEVNRALSALADEARANPDAISVLTRNDATDKTLAALEKSESGRHWLSNLRRFLDEYGYRLTAYDMRFPTWLEDPSFVLATVRGHLKRGPQNNPVDAARDGIADERARVLTVVERAGERCPEKAAAFNEALRLAQAIWHLKEDHGFYIDQASIAHVRLAIAELGRRLAHKGIIAAGEDIFYLAINEARSAMLSGDGLAETARKRSDDIKRRSRLFPPRFLGTLPEEGAPEEAVALLDSPTESRAILRGQAASPGRGLGPARVIISPDQFPNVREGDVLVCRSTAPAWTPLFDVVAGLVSEAGGVLSHPAVVAREYGLPAVVGVSGATELISDGQILEVDGASGTITIRD